jgi:Domain of unknown function (DUF4214)
MPNRFHGLRKPRSAHPGSSRSTLLVEKLEDRTVPASTLTPNQAFVSALYHDLLNRAPDSGGLASWTAMLDQSLDSRSQVVQGFLSSLEYRTDAVENLYQTYLHRNGDTSGLNAFVNYLGQGGTIKEVAAIMLSSQEYFQVRGGGNINGFLQAIYNDVLKRAPDSLGLQSFTSALNNGVSRMQVAQLILDSPEATNLEVTQLYKEFLRRNPDPAGQTAFDNALLNDPTNAGNLFPNDPTGSSGNTTGSNTNTTGSHSRITGATATLPAGTTIISGATVPAGATAISVPGLTLPTGAILLLLPGQPLPTGATQLTGVTIPTGAAELSIPGVTLPSGTVAAAYSGAVLPNGQVIGGTTTNTTGSHSSNGSATGSASAQRNIVGTGVTATVPTGTTVVSGVTVPAGAVPISLSGVTLPPGVVAVALAGQPLPTGATALTDVTVPTGAATLSIPGVTLPSGVVAVALSGTVLANGQVVADPPVTSPHAGMTVEQAITAILSSPEFYMDAGT